MTAQIKKSVFWGVAAALGLIFLYFMILSAISGWNFARSQFSENWYWIIALSFGFGIQIGLFSYLRALHRKQVSGRVIAASGTTSTVAMISCCAHYLANILPIVGISGFAMIIGQYQIEIFWLGIISNLLGVAYLSNKLIKFKSFQKFYEQQH